jgi:hypothetical protein
MAVVGCGLVGLALLTASPGISPLRDYEAELERAELLAANSQALWQRIQMKEQLIADYLSGHASMQETMVRLEMLEPVRASRCDRDAELVQRIASYALPRVNDRNPRHVAARDRLLTEMNQSLIRSEAVSLRCEVEQY